MPLERSWKAAASRGRYTQKRDAEPHSWSTSIESHNKIEEHGAELARLYEMLSNELYKLTVANAVIARVKAKAPWLLDDLLPRSVEETVTATTYSFAGAAPSPVTGIATKNPPAASSKG